MWILRRKGGVTAKRLGQILNCRSSYLYLPKRKDFIINYGKDYDKANLNAHVIHNKLLAYHKLREGGIEQPRLFFKGEVIDNKYFPLLARKKYHSKGRDVIYVHNQEQLSRLDESKYDFLMEYINKKSEYRVHILGDNIHIINVKYDPNGMGDPIVRSKSNGWKQISYNGEFSERLVELARRAVKALKYDFGIVDIVRKKDKLYVLEVNSNAGLEQHKLQIYAEYFRKEEEKWRRNAIR